MPTKKKTPRKKKRSRDIIFPNRPATIRDVARFAHWAGVEFHFAVKEKPKNGE